VIVHLEVDPDYRLTCPVCGKASPGYDTRRRCWRHLDTCQYRTVLVADVPRVECEEHGVHHDSMCPGQNVVLASLPCLRL